MTHEAFKNLSESELIEADHYAETGNREGLRKMQERSSSRESHNSADWHDTKRNPQWD